MRIRRIHFWNIQGDYGSYNDWRLFSDCRSLKSLKFEAFILQIEGRIADFIDFDEYKKKLLFINNDRLILIDLNDLKIKVNEVDDFYDLFYWCFKIQINV